MIVLTVQENFLAANTSLTATFDIMNPSAEQESPALFVVANIMPFAPGVGADVAALLREGLQVGPYYVPKTGQSLMGIPGGADPLYVVAPRFIVAHIGQESYEHGTTLGIVLNTLTFTISMNIYLEPYSTITLSGLTGSRTGSLSQAQYIPITSTGSVFGTYNGDYNSGLWSRSSGTLILQCLLPVPNNTTIIVEFQVQNSFYAQESPAVYASSGAVVDPSLP